MSAIGFAETPEVLTVAEAGVRNGGALRVESWRPHEAGAVANYFKRGTSLAITTVSPSARLPCST